MRFFILLVFISVQIFAQKKVNDTVSYRNYNTLKWTDFKLKAPEDSPYSASVSSGMSYKWSYSTAQGIMDFRYKIEANLYRNFSWSIYTEGKEAVLKHEQLHYDITELFTRKFRKALEEYKISRSIRRDVNLMYERLEAERVAMQLLYDKETNHSINKGEQLNWETKVAELLKEYDSFK